LGKTERALFEAGMPLPEVGELVEIEGGLGQVYERVEGPTLTESVLAAAAGDPGRVAQLADVFAEVHAKVHSCVPSGDLLAIPGQRQLFHRALGGLELLPDDLREAALKVLDNLPSGDRLCHGDFHPYNVLLSPRGPIVIDWNNAHIGNPIEDVARTRLMFSGLEVSEPALYAGVAPFCRAYLERYFELVPERAESELDDWLPVVAAVRLCDHVPELEEWLLKQIRSAPAA
jgi:aminoglycoside phosphotransferase (APT) family kinase protein